MQSYMKYRSNKKRLVKYSNNSTLQCHSYIKLPSQHKQWRINHCADCAMAWGSPLKGVPDLPTFLAPGRVDSTVFEVVTDFNYLDNNNIRSLAQRATDT